MKPVSPVIPGGNFTEIVIAKNQPEYMPLPVIPFTNGAILSRWSLDEAERKAIKVSGEVFIYLMTFGKEKPECSFQVDNPIAPDEPEKFLTPKTFYPITSLPELAQDENGSWFLLKFTDEDRMTVSEVGDIYFFMNCSGNSITPSTIQVERPEIESVEVEFICVLRSSEKSNSLAAEHNIEIFKSNCAICNHEVIGSTDLKPKIEKNNLKLICSVCARESSSQYCFFPETIAQMRSILDKNN